MVHTDCFLTDRSLICNLNILTIVYNATIFSPRRLFVNSLFVLEKNIGHLKLVWRFIGLALYKLIANDLYKAVVVKWIECKQKHLNT